jgi:sucrose phosphorylase
VATFFNILDTHDGIGLMGAKGILSKEEIDFVTLRATEHGALISHKMGEDRTEEPYEINSTWWSALNRDDTHEDIALQVKRYLASRSIALVLQGVPGFYIHGLAATKNDHALVRKTNHRRDINRGILESSAAAEDLKDPTSRLYLIRKSASRLHLTRTRERAFHPHGDQRILMISPGILGVLRTSLERTEHILTLTNVTPRPCNVEIALADVGVSETRWRDLIGEWVESPGRQKAVNRVLGVEGQ